MAYKKFTSEEKIIANLPKPGPGRGIKASALAQLCRLSPNTVNNILGDLVKSGRVVKTTELNSFYYRLAPEPDSQPKYI